MVYFLSRSLVCILITIFNLHWASSSESSSSSSSTERTLSCPSIDTFSNADLRILEREAWIGGSFNSPVNDEKLLENPGTISNILNRLASWIDVGTCRSVTGDSTHVDSGNEQKDWSLQGSELVEIFATPEKFYRRCFLDNTLDSTSTKGTSKGKDGERRFISFILALAVLIHREFENAPSMECLAGVEMN